MTTSSIRAKIDCPIERVWAVVTAVDDYSWRSDLSGTEILDERRFVEYAKGGSATTFTVTAMETCRRWEFDMENANGTLERGFYGRGRRDGDRVHRVR